MVIGRSASLHSLNYRIVLGISWQCSVRHYNWPFRQCSSQQMGLNRILRASGVTVLLEILGSVGWVTGSNGKLRLIYTNIC